jgi:hypothetical protein
VKAVILAEVQRVGYHGLYFVVLPDNAAGKKNRYTAYQFASSPSRSPKIVGRELPMADCKRVINEAIAKHKVKVEKERASWVTCGFRGCRKKRHKKNPMCFECWELDATGDNDG